MARRTRKKKFDEMTLPEKKREFKRHLRTYLTMSVFFVTLNAFTGFGPRGIYTAWFIWPVLGWGIGVALQGLSLYGPLADDEDDHPLPEEDRFDLDRDRPRDRRTAEPLGRTDGRNYRDEDLV